MRERISIVRLAREMSGNHGRQNLLPVWRCVRALIDVKSPGLDRSGDDLSNGLLSDVIRDSKICQLELGGTGSGWGVWRLLPEIRMACGSVCDVSLVRFLRLHADREDIYAVMVSVTWMEIQREEIRGGSVEKSEKSDYLRP